MIVGKELDEPSCCNPEWTARPVSVVCNWLGYTIESVDGSWTIDLEFSNIGEVPNR